MSNKGSSGGGGGGGVGEGSAVSIPDNAKKTIQSIREITGKQHSDEEIYAVLNECFMDPNETAQKLLYLDTFHEVKRKREKKKEIAGTQGPAGRGRQGNYGKGARNASAPKENGVVHTSDRGSASFPASQKVKNNAAPCMTKTPTAIPNGTKTLPNGISNQRHGLPLSVSGVNSETKDGLPLVGPTTISVQLTVTEAPANISAHSFSSLTRDQEKLSSISSASPTSATSTTLSGVYSSASDPLLVPTESWHVGDVGTTEQESGCQLESAETGHIQGNKNVPFDINLSNTEKTASEIWSSMHEKNPPRKSKVAEQTKQSRPIEPALLQVVISEVAAVTDKANSQLLAGSNFPNGQHVTFPTHFRVSEALTNGLTFGSFDASFGQVTRHGFGTSAEITPAYPIETSQGSDETAEEPSSRSKGILSAMEGDSADQPQPPPDFEKAPKSDDIISSDANLKVDQSSQEMGLHSEGNQSVIPNDTRYGFGLMPASASHFVQFDGLEAQAHDVSRPANFVNGNSPDPSGNSAPPVQRTVTAAPPAIHLYRQPFSPNYFPYLHYFPPFYMHYPPHQFLNSSGLPQQPSTGNMYMPPGVKLPLSQLKPGSNAGNPALLTIPSGYSQLTSPPVGFNLSVPSVTSGSSASKEDLAASQLKENHIYPTGSLNEGSALWMPALGQDLTNLQVNSLYNLSLHGQQVPFSPTAQAGHGSFAGLYQPPQTLSAPSNVNNLLQQSQPMAAAVETVSAPTGAYQQPLLAQMNRNSNY
ncbi:GBF-interacting protein 1-like isoform X3 [Gossypium arboreum]|uniref:GBF-interacting protein 1-like isoform X3 n=1 Tax=Gossypium arboreum TaxID=29729 RepID=UPI000819642A|nr:GBF-interacting protein 1-like isoform X3 [Gossypium arboreum]